MLCDFMKVVGQKRKIQISQTPFKPQILLKNNFCVCKTVYSLYVNILFLIKLLLSLDISPPSRLSTHFHL